MMKLKRKIISLKMKDVYFPSKILFICKYVRLMKKKNT